mmetsp:Transcript_6484/g.3675  ORF Transcript_6484/g.3675 Transcript_6484/m.3675 type:complete len:320 (-) Transcript_6484:1812-2771(-)
MLKKLMTAMLITMMLFTSVSGFAAPKQKTITIGVAMSIFDDNFLTLIRDYMQEYIDFELKGKVKIRMVDGKSDAGLQLGQVENFIVQRVNAIIVNPVDTEATTPITEACQKAGVPLVYVNRYPFEKLPNKGVGYVGSQEIDAGLIQMQTLIDMARDKYKKKGPLNVAIMLGILGHSGTIGRTEGNKTIVNRYNDVKVIKEQTGQFKRELGLNIMENWLASGDKIDILACNNDEMAIGAIAALKASGKLDDVVVGGIDATPDAIAVIKTDEMDVSMYQNAKGQAYLSMNLAYNMARKYPYPKEIWIPFEPVTIDNYKEFE